MSIRRKSLLAAALLPFLGMAATPGCGPDDQAPVRAVAEYPAPYDADGALAGAKPASGARPDILLVLLEHLDRGTLVWLPVYDNVLATPTEGRLVLSDAVTPAPESSAAIASVLTGRLPSRHGVSHRDPVPLLHQGYATLPEILRAQGYATRAFVAGERLAKGMSLWQGCDLEPQRVGLAEAPTALASWVASLPKNTPYFAVIHADEAGPPYGRENHDPRAFSDAPPRDVPDAAEAYAELFLLSRPGWSYARDQRRRQGGDAAVSDLERKVKRFLWTPPPSATSSEDPQSLGKRAGYQHSAASMWVVELANVLDRRAKLLRKGPLLTVWTSTGGTAFGEHGVMGPGRHLYDEQIQVPLIFDGLPGPRPLMESASLVDVLPTILDHVGLPSPAEIDGVSLLPVARGEKRRAPVVSEESQDGENTGDPNVRANLVSVRSPRWKYIVRHDLRQGTVVEEAYDLKVDGAERKNLADDRGTVSGVPFDAEMCAAVERIRDGIWGQVAGANAVSGGPYSMGAKVLTDRPRPCGK